jgi:hypothetical protein
MSVGQRVQFTKTVDVTVSIVAHPSGILEITRHSDYHELQKLFGPAKGINGHSDAEVMLYLLAKETGWLDRLTVRAIEDEAKAHSSEQAPIVLEADYSATGRFLLHVRQGDKTWKRADLPNLTTTEAAKDAIVSAIQELRQPDQPAHVYVHTNGIGAGLFGMLKRPSKLIGFALFPTNRRLLESLVEDAVPAGSHVDASRFKGETPHQAREAWQFVAIAGENGEAPPAPGRIALVPVVVDNGYARSPREGEKPTGNAVVLEKPTLRVTDTLAAEQKRTNELLGGIKSAVENGNTSRDSFRKRIVLYADAMGVQTTKDGANLATEDIVAEIFARVSAGGEAAASDILPGRQVLLAKLRETAGTPVDVVDVILGACQRALALWMSREYFLRHKFRDMMHCASKLLLQAPPPDGEAQAQWIAQRDDLLEAIQWLDPDLGSKDYHPSHDAETAFDTLHNGLGFKPGTAVLTLAELAKVAIGRIRRAVQPTQDQSSGLDEANTSGIPSANMPLPNGVRSGQADFVVGGPQRPPWHSGTGQGTGVF